MFLSKIWFVLVGLLAGIAVTAAFVAPRPADRQIEQLEGQRLDRAQYSAEQILKTDARRWIDYVAKLGRDANLIESLDAASRGSGELRVLHETVRNRLRVLVPDRQGIGAESIVAVDKSGRVIGRVGDDEGEYGESIGGAEAVADALRGYMTDDTWGANNRIRRIGAAPVYSKGRDRIVGALVVNAETGKRLAELWKRNLGVDVAIVLRNKVLSATLPEALLNDLPKLIADHASEIEKHKRTSALPIYMGNERMLAVAAPFAGEAAQQGAYYVLLTKKSPQSNPWALLSSSTSDDMSWGKFPWLPLGAGIIGILVIGLALQRIEVEKPLKRLRTEVQSLARREIVKLDDTRYGGMLGGIARDINATVEHFTHAPLPKSETAKKDISAILDPIRAPTADGKAFEITVPSGPAKAAPPAPAAMAASLFGAPKATAPTVGMPAGTTPSPVSVPALPPTMPAAPAAPPAFSPMARPPLPMTPVPPNQTMMGFGRPMASEEDPDEHHFRQVFDQYLATRTQCGESNDGLTLDKFRAKLLSNRQQLVAKYGCRSAHFAVYVKDGKAAIRATPIRS